MIAGFGAYGEGGLLYKFNQENSQLEDDSEKKLWR